MPRSAIRRGFPSPIYLTELGNRARITRGGTYEVERGARVGTASATIEPPTLSATGQVIISAQL